MRKSKGENKVKKKTKWRFSIPRVRGRATYTRLLLFLLFLLRSPALDRMLMLQEWEAETERDRARERETERERSLERSRAPAKLLRWGQHPWRILAGGGLVRYRVARLSLPPRCSTRPGDRDLRDSFWPGPNPLAATPNLNCGIMASWTYFQDTT